MCDQNHAVCGGKNWVLRGQKLPITQTTNAQKDVLNLKDLVTLCSSQAIRDVYSAKSPLAEVGRERRFSSG